MRELLADFDKGIAPPEPVVIRDWLDRWMAEHIIPHRNQATSERYAAIIATHLKPRFGHLELNRLTPAQVRVMESDLGACLRISFQRRIALHADLILE